jgi:uncharacterized protein
MVEAASYGAVAGMFLAFCTLLGVAYSPLLLVFSDASLVATFFITGGVFLAMSAYGTLTKKDLSSWRSFLLMGFSGVIIAALVNAFVRSDMLGFIISCVGVVVFTGLAAYHTQKLRAWAEAGDDRLALSAALVLYIDFINLFISLLRFTGRGRR